MASTSEHTFGQRYTKAREFEQYLLLLPAYSPGVNTLEPSKFGELLTQIETANADASSKFAIMQTVRDERYTLYYGDDGLLKRAARIREYLSSILPKGKKAKDFVLVQKIVQKMRGVRITAKPALKPDGSVPKTLSTYEVSFGSIHTSGRDILEVIKIVPNYNPNNASITAGGFLTHLDEVTAKNSSVAEAYEKYNNAIELRGDLYNELDDRIAKIKGAIAGQYGKDSNEYKGCVKY